MTNIQLNISILGKNLEQKEAEALADALRAYVAGIEEGAAYAGQDSDDVRRVGNIPNFEVVVKVTQ
jgi:hypothetical protein